VPNNGRQGKEEKATQEPDQASRYVLPSNLTMVEIEELTESSSHPLVEALHNLIFVPNPSFVPDIEGVGRGYSERILNLLFGRGYLNLSPPGPRRAFPALKGPIYHGLRYLNKRVAGDVAVLHARSHHHVKRSKRIPCWSKLGSKVNLRGFKEFVMENFRPDTPIFRVIASEKDELEGEELVGKVDVWMKLIRLSLPQEG